MSYHTGFCLLVSFFDVGAEIQARVLTFAHQAFPAESSLSPLAPFLTSLFVTSSPQSAAVSTAARFCSRSSSFHSPEPTRHFQLCAVFIFLDVLKVKQTYYVQERPGRHKRSLR